MQLPLQTFTTLVANAAAAVQGSARPQKSPHF